jgi:hypothetical protein
MLLMTGITLFQNDRDYKLTTAYSQFERVHEDFKKHYRRTPNCGVFVGTQGERETQLSSVSLRWTDPAGKTDAEAIHRFYSTGAF